LPEGRDSFSLDNVVQVKEVVCVSLCGPMPAIASLISPIA